jgi:hypothetical protein
MIAVAPNRAHSSERSIDRARQPHDQAADSKRQRRAIISLDNGVNVVVLDGKMKYAKSIPRSHGHRASNGVERSGSSQRRDASPRPHGHVHRKASLVIRPQTMSDRAPPTRERRTPSPSTNAAPSFGDREIHLFPSPRHLE